jgi:uncharacterized delta-60 repeat protein
MHNLAFAALAFSVGLASSGDLDTSFGKEGKVTNDFFGLTDVARNIIIDKNNKILISGGATKKNLNDHFAMARYHEDGSLDLSFGKKGKVTTGKIADNKYVDGGIEGMGLQSDGKIIACGRANTLSARGLVLVRYKSDGSLDSSFGEEAFALTPDPAETTIWPLALIIDAEDKIIVVASAFQKNGDNASFALFRFNADGTSDTSFGTAGQVFTSISEGANVPRAVKIDRDNKIVVGGFSGDNKWVVARYNSDGSLDKAFGHAGIATILFNPNGVDTLHALAIQEDGKIIVGGDVQVGSYAGLRMVDFGLARLSPEGELDLSFNQSGKQITYFVQPAASTLWALTIQADGKIVAVGDASIVNALGVARYNTDGSLDMSFGEEGKKITPCGKTCHWEGVGLQPDGKIVAAGYIWNGKHYDMALVRHHQ